MTSPVYKQIRVYDPPVALAPPPVGSAIPDTGLKLWLRSENIPTGSKWITSWPDASGRGYTAKRLFKTRHRITWDTTTIGNGHKSMSWGGKGESRLALPDAFKLNQYGTFAMVYRLAPASAGLACAWWDRNNIANRSFAWSDTGSAAGFSPALPGPVTGPHPTTGTTTRVVMLSASPVGWTVRSAARVTTNVDLLTGFARPAGRFVLGGQFSDNQNLEAAETYAGAIAEVLYYNTNFSETRQASIMQELCTKFGVPYV